MNKGPGRGHHTQDASLAATVAEAVAPTEVEAEAEP